MPAILNLNRLRKYGLITYANEREAIIKLSTEINGFNIGERCNREHCRWAKQRTTTFPRHFKLQQDKLISVYNCTFGWNFGQDFSFSSWISSLYLKKNYVNCYCSQKEETQLKYLISFSLIVYSLLTYLGTLYKWKVFADKSSMETMSNCGNLPMIKTITRLLVFFMFYPKAPMCLLHPGVAASRRQIRKLSICMLFIIIHLLISFWSSNKLKWFPRPLLGYQAWTHWVTCNV